MKRELRKWKSSSQQAALWFPRRWQQHFFFFFLSPSVHTTPNTHTQTQASRTGRWIFQWPRTGKHNVTLAAASTSLASPPPVSSPPVLRRHIPSSLTLLSSGASQRDSTQRRRRRRRRSTDSSLLLLLGFFFFLVTSPSHDLFHCLTHPDHGGVSWRPLPQFIFRLASYTPRLEWKCSVMNIYIYWL